MTGLRGEQGRPLCWRAGIRACIRGAGHGPEGEAKDILPEWHVHVGQGVHDNLGKEGGAHSRAAEGWDLVPRRGREARNEA